VPPRTGPANQPLAPRGRRRGVRESANAGLRLETAPGPPPWAVPAATGGPPGPAADPAPVIDDAVQVPSPPPADDPVPAATDPVRARVEAWEPGLADPGQAPAIRELVLTANPGSPADAAGLLAAASGLVLWADEQGLDQAPADLLDEPTLRRYVHTGMDGYSLGSRTVVHRSLRRLAAAAALPRPTTPIPDAPPGRPYTPEDIDALLTWAAGQGNPLRRHAALTVLAATLGTGLPAADLGRLRGTDVTTAPDGTVLVQIPGPAAREAVCHRRYEQLLARLADAAGTDSLLDPGRQPTPGRPVERSIRRLSADPRVPALTAQRCRSTWLGERLADQIPLNVIMPAAAVTNAKNLAGRGLALPERDLQALRDAPPAPDPVPRPGPARRPPATTAGGPASAAAERVETHNPMGVDPRHMPAARAIARAAGPSNADAADALLIVAARLLAWCDQHGIPADPHHALDLHSLELFRQAPDGALFVTAAAHVRTQPGLRRAAAHLRPDQAPQPPDETFPYTAKQTRALLAHAHGQPDPRLRHAMLAALALALGLGAGLRAPELTRLNGTDVTRDPTAGTVLVRLPDRTVPVLAAQEELAHLLATEAGTRPVADPTGPPGDRHQTTLLIRAAHPPSGTPALSTPRCRATWIHTHLAHGTRLDAFLAAADLKARNVDSALSRVPPVDAVTSRRLLRG